MSALYQPDSARSAAQRAYMEGLEAARVCIFCPGHQTEPIIHKGVYWFVTTNRYPYVGTRAHYLIVSRAHVRAFHELPDEAGAELWSIRRLLLDRCHEGATVPLATTTVERSGDARYNGGSVTHFHVHFIEPEPVPTKTIRIRGSAYGTEDTAGATVLGSLADVAAKARRLHEEGHRLVLTSGSFDLIHLGHVKYLQRAKEQGDVLFVGVDSDEKIRGRKGPERPLVPEEERVQVLTFQRPVDQIYVKQADDAKWALIEAIQPHVLVVTADHTYSDQELEALHAHCGEVAVIERQASVTTSERIRQMYMHLGDRLGPKLAQALPDLIEAILRDR